MSNEHHYFSRITWTGAGADGTKTYKSYSRDYDMEMAGKIKIPGSSDPAFRGDATRHNPEDLLVGATASCHMLWYLHLCAVNGIIVTGYEDKAEGIMTEGGDTPARFTKIILRPHITITPESDADKAMSLHHVANEKCFIANSLNCPVVHEATIEKK
ncbi:OsmC family protein [Kordiimonas sp.]|uniref:OsmC family protein n=1 Tax=Kordiimonas sp. TaxID=1970157 RepID=UPI003A9323FB